MNLTIKDLHSKECTVIPEEDIHVFSERTLTYVKNTLSNSSNADCTDNDIQKFLLFNSITMAKEIKGLNNFLFACEPTEGALLWNVILDNGVIVLDSYEFDKNDNEIHKILGFEILSTSERKCETNLDLSSIENKEELDLEMIKTSSLLRLTFYIINILEENRRN